MKTTWHDLFDPHNEFGSLDFDAKVPDYDDDCDWWRQQDADMTRRELEEIESLAEIQEYRTQGYM